jgi:predicted O-linked N-acetylglucosamine transferase (SPINDLY family)
MTLDSSFPEQLQAAFALQQSGRLAEAETSYRQLIGQAGDDPLLHDNLGVTLARQGRIGEAIPCFQQALRLDPHYPPARNNLVRALLETGELKAAADTCEAFLRADGRDVQALTLAASIAERMARPKDALLAYELALQHAPDHYPALLGRAELLLGLQRPEAPAAFDAAVAQYPGRPEPRHGLARALAGQGRTTEATALWWQVIRQHPNFLPAWIGLLDCCWQRGQADAARRVLAAAVAAKPQAAALHGALGDCCGAQGAFPEAISCYRQALQGGDDQAWLGRLVALLARQGHHLDAIDLILGRLAKHPDEVASHVAVGRAYAMIGDADHALPHFEEAVRLGCPDGVRVNAALVLPSMPATVGEMLAWRHRQLAELNRLMDSGLSIADPLVDVRLTNFYLVYQGLDDRPHQEALSRLYRQAAPSLLWTAPHCREGAPPRTAGRIRVGFLSSFLCNHTIGRLNAGWIEHLDRSRFEVAIIHGGDRDAMAEQLAAMADRTVLPGPDLPTIREQVAKLELDVLIYPDIGMEATSYFLAYSRLAPVQVVTLGHPVTTGIPTIDYFLSDASMEPAGAQAHYSERLINLGTLPCHYAEPVLPDDAGGDRARLGLAVEDHLYVCPQTLFKLHPEFDAYLADIVAQDPRARLVFIAGPEDAFLKRRFCERLAAGGLDPQRLQFLDRLSRPDFLRLLRVADVLLDPLHFAAGNSAYEAIAVGTPMVTQPGAFLRGRLASAYYQTIGVTDGVVDDRAAYVATAVAIATSPDRRRELAARILANKGPLFGNLHAVRRLEAFLADAVAGRDLSRQGWLFPEL